MATNVNTNPFPLGKIIPGAGFASASVPITQNYTDLATKDVGSFFIQSFPGNTGAYLYVCNNASAPDVSGYTNILAILLPGDSFPPLGYSLNTLTLGGFWVGAVNATDFATGSFTQR